jgi:hypothetical protein
MESETGTPISDVEADGAIGRCAPSGPRSLTPVVRPTAGDLVADRLMTWPALPPGPVRDGDLVALFRWNRDKGRNSGCH